MSGPIFIVGMPRSGTTLMRSLLSAHNNITIAPETHFLDVFVKRIEGSHIGRDQFAGFWTAFSSSPQFEELGLDATETAEVIHRSGCYSPKNVFRVLLTQYARTMNKHRWGEKTPEHYKHIGTLLQWFPDARVIYMLRDPRAVCASLLKVPWRKRGRIFPWRLEPIAVRRARWVWHDALVWRSAEQKFQAVWHHRSRIKLVRYEDLVGAPEPTVQSICDFLGEPYDVRMIEGRSWNTVGAAIARNGRLEPSWTYKHLRQTLDTISTAPVDKWKAELSVGEVAIIQQICASRMLGYGYTLNSIGPWAKAIGRISSIPLAGAWLIKTFFRRRLTWRESAAGR